MKLDLKEQTKDFLIEMVSQGSGNLTFADLFLSKNDVVGAQYYIKQSQFALSIILDAISKDKIPEKK